MRTRIAHLITLLALLFSGAVSARLEPEPLEVRDFKVKGAIDEENILFTISLTAEVRERNQELALVSGDLVLEELRQPAAGVAVRYVAETKTYAMFFAGTGSYEVNVTFAARPAVVADGSWRESVFLIPASRVRELEVLCDRTDLEVLFPGALRVNRRLEEC